MAKAWKVGTDLCTWSCWGPCNGTKCALPFPSDCIILFVLNFCWWKYWIFSNSCIAALNIAKSSYIAGLNQCCVVTQVSCVPIAGFGFNYLERKWTWADLELGRNQGQGRLEEPVGSPPPPSPALLFVNNWNEAWFLSGPKNQNFQF